MTVPLIPSQPISPFGFVDEADLLETQKQDRDGTYVPGFSEMRRDFDTKVGQFNRREISFDAVPTLPVNLRWARLQNAKGEPNSNKAFNHSRKGYRFVTKADLNQPWFKDIPGGCTWNAAGVLQNGDTGLMVCEGKQAAKNELQKRRDTDARVSGAVDAFEQNVRQLGALRKGSDPRIEKIADYTNTKTSPQGK